VSRPQILVGFIGKQDPVNDQTGREGAFLSGLRQLPFAPAEVLLLFTEGASDRVDSRNEPKSEGDQGARSGLVAEVVRELFPEVQVHQVEVQADPSSPRALFGALRVQPDIHRLRSAWKQQAEVHVLIAGGTPAMRELLTALQVGAFFGPARGWYQPDRGAVREEVPLVVQTLALRGAVTALRLGEYRQARQQVSALDHPDAQSALTLLDILGAYQVRKYVQAQRLLEAWRAPPQLQDWHRQAISALQLMRYPAGELMVFWNDAHEDTDRGAVLSYATLLEVALSVLHSRHFARTQMTTAEGQMNDLALAGIELSPALDGRQGIPRQLYRLRSAAIHGGDRVSPGDGKQARQAATDLLRSFPEPDARLASFLRAPHQNAFAPQRRADLSEALQDWLSS
jgi:hypothetical protein